MENSGNVRPSSIHVQSIREIFESKNTSYDSNTTSVRKDSSVSKSAHIPQRPSFLHSKVKDDALLSKSPVIATTGEEESLKDNARKNNSSFLHSASSRESLFNAQTRVSIKRSPAFRQDKKSPRESTSEPVTSPDSSLVHTTNLTEPNNPQPVKKVSLRRKPPITAKPACLTKSPLSFPSAEIPESRAGDEENAEPKEIPVSDPPPNDPLFDVLRSPLPPGPPPQKPPRTFLHDVYSELKQGKTEIADNQYSQPEKPLRSKRGKKRLPLESESETPSKESGSLSPEPFVLVRSKTEPSLSPRRKKSDVGNGAEHPTEHPTEPAPYAVTNLTTAGGHLLSDSPSGLDPHTGAHVTRRKQVAVIKPQVPVRPFSTCIPPQQDDKDFSSPRSSDEDNLDYSCTKPHTSRVSNPVRWNQFSVEEDTVAAAQLEKRPKSSSPPKTATIKRLSASVLPLTNLKVWKDAKTGSHESVCVKSIAKGASRSSLTINRQVAVNLTSSAASTLKTSTSGRKHSDSYLSTPNKSNRTFSDGRRSMSAEHIYSEPILRQGVQRTLGRSPGALHYMSTSIVENDERERNLSSVDLAVAVTSEDSGSDVTESDNDEVERTRMVEDRKNYVRRVSSNVCDLERRCGRKLSLDVSGRLFEVFLVVGLYYDRDLKVHLPYIKSRYPAEATVPLGIEELCFPDSAQWPPPFNSSQSYTLVLTDHKGRRQWAYCKRIVPEGSHTVIPIAYCLVSRHRAPALFSKVITELTSCHGLADTSFKTLLESLHVQSFPRPGGFIKFELPPALCHSPVVIKRVIDPGLEESDLDLLFSQLDSSTLVHVLGTLLLERKLVLVSDQLSVVTGCVQGLLSMINPFMWHHTLVPVLPSSMFEVTSAPTPYILGVLRSSITDWEVLEPDQGMLVDLDSGRVLRSVGDESTLLPRRLSQALKAALSSVPSLCMAGEPARNALLSQTFLYVFVELCGHYQSHIAIENGEKVFKKDDFIASHPSKSVQMFLEWFTETAMFTLFIESRLKDGPVISSQFERKVLEQPELRNSPLILRNQKLFSRKMRTLGDKIRDMNVFG